MSFKAFILESKSSIKSAKQKAMGLTHKVFNTYEDKIQNIYIWDEEKNDFIKSSGKVSVGRGKTNDDSDENYVITIKINGTKSYYKVPSSSEYETDPGGSFTKNKSKATKMSKEDANEFLPDIKHGLDAEEDVIKSIKIESLNESLNEDSDDIKEIKRKAMNLQSMGFGYYEDRRGDTYVWDEKTKNFIEKDIEDADDEVENAETHDEYVASKLNDVGIEAQKVKLKYGKEGDKKFYKGPAVSINIPTRYTVQDLKNDITKALDDIEFNWKLLGGSVGGQKKLYLVAESFVNEGISDIRSFKREKAKSLGLKLVSFNNYVDREGIRFIWKPESDKFERKTYQKVGLSSEKTKKYHDRAYIISKKFPEDISDRIHAEMVFGLLRAEQKGKRVKFSPTRLNEPKVHFVNDEPVETKRDTKNWKELWSKYESEYNKMIDDLLDMYNKLEK